MAATYFKTHTQDELRSAFRQFDQDGSGYIQADELENIMYKMGKRYSKAEINAMVKALDTSGDGKISFEEFAKIFQ
jgi:calmodulin